MAKNRKPEPHKHDESSSSDDEEAQSEESINEQDSDTESDSEAEQQFAIKPSAADKDLKTPSGPQSSSDEDSDEGSDENSDEDEDSGEDTPPPRPDNTLKSIKSEPENASKKSTSKPIPATLPPSKPSASAAKRTADGDANGDRALKKPKKEGDVGVAADDTLNKVGEDPKKQYFQRIFSDEDEIAILEGLILYKAHKGIDPTADLAGFHEFIKQDLHVDVSKVQIGKKIRNFKMKLEKNSVLTKNGSAKKFSNPHEHKLFELSKQLWSVEANGAGVDSSNAKPRKKANVATNMEVALDAVVSAELASSFVGRKSVEKMILEDGLELLDGAKKLELQEKWKQLKAEEVKIYLKRLRLMQEQAEAVLLALQGLGST